jgi:hypothetical protein
MGSVGHCFGNALIESFWSRMQVELLDRKRWNTRVELPAPSWSACGSSTTASAVTRH